MPLNDNQPPALSPSLKAGGDLAEELIRKVIDTAANTAGLEKVPFFEVKREVVLSKVDDERHAFVEGFMSFLRANTGLRQAEGVSWMFDLSGGYRAPSELEGTLTTLPQHFMTADEQRRFRQVPMVFAEPPQGIFYVRLHPFEKCGPTLVTEK